MSRHLHFMGAGGVGMCGLAEVLLANGAVVSGCDLSLSERTRRLESAGATIHKGHHPSHLDGVDALVVTAAVDTESDEVVAAMRRGVPVARRSELLGELMRCRRGVAVAGTHGKTTTTALIGHVLTEAGLEPTVLVGGHAKFMGAYGRHGGGDVLVCEADEYDRSFLDLASEIAVITNVEAEHLDCYRDEEELHTAFASFANHSSTMGAVIVGIDDPGVRRLRPMLRRKVVTFGCSHDADVRASDVDSSPGGSRFKVSLDRDDLGTVSVPLPGHHNVLNALAALAAGLQLDISFERLAGSCESFEGVGRRFEVLGDRAGVTVVDDYAHHPTEVRAVLEAARQAMPARRVIAVFQPHLYSRTRDFAEGFAEALMEADVALVLPIYPARERPIEGVTSELIVESAARRGHPNARIVPTFEESCAALDEHVRPGDVLITMGAGNVDLVAEEWLGAHRE